GVGVAQRFGNFPGDLESVGERKLLLPPDAFLEVLPLDTGHDIVEEPVGCTGVVERKDMGVLEACLDTDLAQEPVAADRRGELRPEHFDRHVPIVLPVVGEVDVGHAPGADLPIELIAVRERGPQAINLVHHAGTHVGPRWGADRSAPPTLNFALCWSLLLYVEELLTARGYTA